MIKKKREQVTLTMSPSTRTLILQEAKKRGFTFGVTNDVIIAEWLEYRKQIQGYRERKLKMESSMLKMEATILRFGGEIKFYRAWEAVNVAQLRKYKQTKNTFPPFDCPFCEAKDFQTAYKLARHCAKEHPFQDGHPPLQHQSATDSGGPFQCPYCNVDPFGTLDELSAHISKEHKKD